LLAAAVDAFQFATLPVLAHETTGTNPQGHVMERCARNADVSRPAHSLSSSETILWAQGWGISVGDSLTVADGTNRRWAKKVYRA
jgi:hypothetical protein